jgi:transposase, IS30 family
MRELDRDDGHHPGVALTEKRERYFALIRRGFNNSEACRMVRVHRRTGTRWRFGRNFQTRTGQTVHYPPVIITQTVHGTETHPTSSTSTTPDTSAAAGRYLSPAERITIADLLRAGLSIRAIAAELGRAPSTVSREVRRNRDERRGYLPHTAQQIARVRSARRRRRRVVTDPVLGQAMTQILAIRWSPEQAAHALKERFPGQRRRHLCVESIYQAIYDPDVPMTRAAKTSLRTHRRRRRPRTTAVSRRGRLNGMTMIDQRPATVEDRQQPGHWEGDLIMGKGNRSAIATLVERRARFLMLVHVPEAHTKEAIRDGLSRAMLQLPVGLRRTLTWDQGKEMALHAQISRLTGLDVYFCKPHSPWQRGSNENMNGLLRQYFPQGNQPGRS